MFVLAHILSLSLFFLNVSASPRTEAQALVQWKESFSSSSLDSWSLSNFRNFCKWTGIRCNSAGSVSRINLHDANITGTVALFSFSSFPDLTRLDISSNHFDGPLSSVGKRFSMITYLDLSANTFEGGIPPEIGNLKEFRYLSFYDNNLNGTIPYQVSKLQKLWYLDLGSNYLATPDWSKFAAMPQLTHLSFFYNVIDSEFPYFLLSCFSFIFNCVPSIQYCRGY